MRTNSNVFWVLFGVLGLSAACTTAQQNAAGSTSTSPNSGAATTNAPASQVADTGQNAAANPPANDVSAAGVRGGTIGVADVATALEGATVTVSGVFMGFSGPCFGDAPSRSAWHLAASKEPQAECVYVDAPFPPGLSPAIHSGTPAVVTGKVVTLGATRYLQATGQ